MNVSPENKFTILLDCVALGSAGGLTVGHGICGALPRRHQVNWVILAPADAGYERFRSQSVRVIPASRHFKRNLLWVARDAWIRRQVHLCAPDVVFSLCNIPLPVKIPQLTLLHWPYAVYPESVVWERMPTLSRIKRKFRLSLFRRRLKYADQVTVQTENIRERFIRIYKFPETRISTIPSAVNLSRSAVLQSEADPWPWIEEERKSGMKYLLYLTRYYDHKNVEVLLDVSARLQAGKEPVKILITIGADQDPRAKSLLEKIESRGIENTMINLGPVEPQNVRVLLSKVDGMLMPTLLESFGLPYFEAMHAGLPIFTSNLDFAQTVCRDAAFYFDPMDPDDIRSVIKKGFADSERLKKLISLGKNYAAGSPDWPEIVERYLTILTKLVHNNEGQVSR